MVMYGNEILKGSISDQLSLISEDTLVANISVRAPSWSNDILSRDDFFWEPRIFRFNSNISFIGTAYLYPILEPTVGRFHCRPLLIVISILQASSIRMRCIN